jgi:hypothetical protein
MSGPDSSGGRATGYVLGVRGSIPGMGKNLSELHSVENGCPLQCISQTFPSEVKRPGCEVDHSL